MALVTQFNAIGHHLTIVLPDFLFLMVMDFTLD